MHPTSGRSAARWSFTIGNSRKLEMTPVVVDGVMYVTAVNEAYALDARTGRASGISSGRAPKASSGDAAGGINRGVAMLGDRVFMVTDNAHLLALHRLDRQPALGCRDGRLARELRRHLRAAGGERPGHLRHLRRRRGHPRFRRGLQSLHRRARLAFLDHSRAGRAAVGNLGGQGAGARMHVRLAYRHLRRRDRPALLDHRQSVSRTTTATSAKATTCIPIPCVALDPATGKLRWYFQYTPHDLHDWDSAQTAMLVDADFEGKPRKLLLHANRNGFFYVLDRTNGEFLRATPFVEKADLGQRVSTPTAGPL